MFEIKTEIDIDASAGQVWSVLTDFAAYTQWNPFIREIIGTASEGSKLKVTIQPQGGKAMVFKPTLLVAEPEREFRWLGCLFSSALFKGEHYFQLVPASAGKVRLIHGELFSGLLVGLLKSDLNTATKAGFIAMNQALKARAESNIQP